MRRLSTRRTVAAAAVLAMGTTGGGLIAAVATAVVTSPAWADPVSIGPQSMEGSLQIRPGDYIAAGYRFSISGAHPANTVTFANAKVTIPVSCTSGGPAAGTITINLTGGPYNVAANDTSTKPASNQADPASYQGSTVAPNLCGGGVMYSSSNSPAPKGGATFSADVYAAVPAKISVSFHFRDPNAKGRGNINCADPSSNPYPADKGPCGASWSATTGITVKNPPPGTDVCPNLPGGQPVVPDLFVLDGAGNCVPEPGLLFVPCVVSAGVTQTATTVTGTLGDDTIDCTNASPGKTIDTFAGNDTITGTAFDDTIHSGDGNDTVTGLAGNDVIDGGDGNNTITGSEGDDTITSGTGNDTLTGSAGNDFLDGGSGIDTITGSEGNDTLVGPSNDGSRDTVSGGLGIDTCTGPGLDNDIVSGCEVLTP